MNDPVVVRPVSVGICGSDLHVIGLGMQGVTLGHEIAGTHNGRPVAIQPAAYCGQCNACQRGDHHVCEVAGQGIYGIHRDGGMADELVIESQCLVELPAEVDVRSACLVEPIAVGVHAVNKADLVPGMKVAVIGAGSIGLVAAAAAKSKGLDQVDIVARHAPQFEAAERLGLQPVQASDVGTGYDVVIDAAGTESSLSSAIGAIRPAGTIVVPGVVSERDPAQGRVVLRLPRRAQGDRCRRRVARSAARTSRCPHHASLRIRPGRRRLRCGRRPSRRGHQGCRRRGVTSTP